MTSARRPLVLALLLAVAASCSTSRVRREPAAPTHQPPSGPPADVVSPPTPPIPAVMPGAPWMDSVLRGMTLREKAGQMVWPSVFGDYVSGDSPQWERVQGWIRNDRVGGFTISVGSPVEIAQKLNEMQLMSAVPLLFGADFEYGAGFRARGGYFVPNAIDLGGAVVFPPQMALGASRDTALAYEQGRVTALEGRALGVHITYAPVLDVNNNPANPVINVRSYGADPVLAAAMGRSFVRGVQEHGMIATGKHFPGHGDTDVNSHLGLPVVTVSRQRLDSVELVPFRAAVGVGLDAIMSFHGAMPALDSSGVPGTLSSRVIGGVLRSEMGFRGVVISDAMDMRGVLDTYGAERAAKMAVAAGVDILIQPLNVTQTIDAVVAGVNEGLYSEARLDSSVTRILALKERLSLHRRRTIPVDSVRWQVGTSPNQEAARLVAEKSITLVRDGMGRVPFRRGESGQVLSITIARRADLSAGVAFNGELRRGLGTVRAEFVSAEDVGTTDRGRLLALADSAGAVVLSYYVGQSWDSRNASAPQEFTELVRSLELRSRRFVLISFGNPYLLQQVPEVTSYMIAWGGFPVSQSAAAQALSGDRSITGRLPIAIPPLAAMGDGLTRERRAN
jgi:beta-N-acetylhexosaminidase